MYEGKKDNDVFSELQERYLVTRSGDLFWQMYQLVERFERRYIKKYCRLNGLTSVYSEEEISDLASDMAVWFMQMYTKRKEFKVDAMSSYAHFAFLKIFMAPNRIAEDLRKKALEELTPNREYIAVYDTFELPSEEKERALWDEVAPGNYQKCLPFDELVGGEE